MGVPSGNSQHVSPILFWRQVTARLPSGHGVKDLTRKMLTGLVTIRSDHDPQTRLSSTCRPQHIQLRGRNGPSGRDVSRLRITPQQMVRHAVDGAFADDQASIIRFGARHPKPLGSADGKAFEIVVAALEAEKIAAGIAMREHGIAALVAPDGADKAPIGQRGAKSSAFQESVAVINPAGPMPLIEHRDGIAFDHGDILCVQAVIDRRIRRRANPGAKHLAGFTQPLSAATLKEVDDGSVIGVVTNGKICPMPVRLPRDGDLVALSIGHDDAIAAALFPVQAVAHRRREGAEVDLPLEAIEFVGSVLDHAPGFARVRNRRTG